MDEIPTRPDIPRGRRIAIACLSVIGLTAAVLTAVQLTRPDTNKLVALGNLTVVLLMIYMIWRGRVWPRLVLGGVIAAWAALVLTAAFIGGALRTIDASLASAAVLYVVSFLYLVQSRDAQAFFLAQRDHPIPALSKR